MEKKTALVTGANAGMGRATALALARQGFHVILLCRSRPRGEEALHFIQQAAGRDSASLMLCDLSDLADIRRFAADYLAWHAQTHILVCNAGVLSMKRQQTKDHLELHLGVCHMGHFLLVNLLRGTMAPDARIIMVSSIAHKIGRIDFTDMNLTRHYSVVRAYSQAKLCNLLFTRALARRLIGTAITINAVHPGAVITGIGGKRAGGDNKISTFRRVAGAALGLFVKTPEEGAATAIYVATDPACEGVSGAYYASCKQAKPGKRATDAELAEKLWAWSLDTAGMTKEEAYALRGDDH